MISKPVAWQYTSHVSGACMLSHQPPDRLIEADQYEIIPLYTADQMAETRRLERERCCSVIYGQCGSDNVAERTVKAIRALEDEK